MIPVPFKQSNCTMQMPAQLGGISFRAYNNGEMTITAWQISDEEIEFINRTKTVYLSVFSGKTAPPCTLLVKPPFYDNADAFQEIFYTNLMNPSAPGIWVWNAIDKEAPQTFKMNNSLYMRDKAMKQISKAEKVLTKGDVYIRAACDNFAESMIGDSVLCLVEGPGMENTFELMKEK